MFNPTSLYVQFSLIMVIGWSKCDEHTAFDEILNIQTNPQQLWTDTTMDKLKKELFMNYDRFSRPYEHFNVTKIRTGISIIHLETNELKSTITLTVWVRLVWTDPKLNWNETNYGIEVLRISEHEVWHPDLYLYNGASGGFPILRYNNHYLLIYPNGETLWVPQAELVALCSYNLRYWPFDIQHCELKISPWTHSGSEIELTMYNNQYEADVCMHSSDSNYILTGSFQNGNGLSCALQYSAAGFPPIHVDIPHMPLQATNIETKNDLCRRMPLESLINFEQFKRKIQRRTLLDGEDAEATVLRYFATHHLLPIQWTITTQAYITSKYYKCCPDPYCFLQYNLTLIRNPDTYKVLIVPPAIVNSVLILIQFWLPPHGKEKVILNGFLFVFLTIFLLYFATTIAPAGSETPLIVLFYSNNLGLLCLAMISNVVTYAIQRSKRLNFLSVAVKTFLDGRWSKYLVLEQFTRLYVRKETFDGSKKDSTRSSYEDWFLTLIVNRFLFLIYTLVYLTIACIYFF